MKTGNIFMVIIFIALIAMMTNCNDITSDNPPDNNGNNNDKISFTKFSAFNSSFYNPIRTNHNMGDPWVVHHNDMYYFCGGAINIFASPTISGMLAYGLTVRNVLTGLMPSDMVEVWAPELHFYNNRWYIFFAASHGTTSNQIANNRRMHVLRSQNDNPLGTWEYTGKLNLPEDQWAIDGTFFEHNGRIFLIWSGWNDPSQGIGTWRQNLYISELEPGDPTKVKSDTTRVRIARAEHSWETSGLPQVEGPVVVKSPLGTVFCVYSASYSGSNDYALGYLRLTGADPMVALNWEKNPAPIFSADPDNDIYSPGHCSITKSPDGKEHWVIYHAAKAKDSGWDRNARAQKLEWVNDRPFLGNPDPLWTLQPLPSGEKADRIIFQAEDMVRSGGALVTNIPEGRGQAVSLTSANARITMTVDIRHEGRYAIYVRHSTPFEEQKNIRLFLNESLNSVNIRASRSGAQGSYTMDAIVVTLIKGVNTLAFGSPERINIDCVILERMPI